MAVGLDHHINTGQYVTSFSTSTRPNVFVTGGQGHVGRTLIPTLQQQGYNVHSLARTMEERDRLRAMGCKSVQAGDVLSLEAIISAAWGCTHFVHCASTFSHVDTSRTQLFHSRNILVATHAIAACRQLRIRKLVLLSNCAVLCDGSAVSNANEKTPLSPNPLGACGKSMREVEKIILDANDGAMLQTSVIRPRLLWGGHGDPFTTALIQAAKAQRLRLVSGGNFRTSTCHVRNACEAIMCALRHDKGGEIYFVTDGCSVHFGSFVRSLLVAAKVDCVDSVLSNTVPLWLARRVARVAEWYAQYSNTEAMLSEAGVCLIGQEMTVCDDKARGMISYCNVVSVDQGLTELRGTTSYFGC